MKNSRTLAAIVLVFLFCGTACSQTLEELLLEEAASDNPETAERLDELKRNPVNLNSADENLLASLPFFDSMQARRIIEERAARGRFTGIDDFLARVNLDEDMAEIIVPYITFRQQNFLSGTSITVRSRFIRIPEKTSACKKGQFAGSPLYSYNRITVTNKNFYARLLFHKDPGESSFLDHGAGFIEMPFADNRGTLMAGTYLIEAGQGLTVSGPYSQFKGVQSVRAGKNRCTGLSGYCSSTEYGYLRGAAARIMTGNTVYTCYVSHTALDATLNPDSTVSSFRTNGFHRTGHEIAARNTAGEYAAGIVAERYIGKLRNSSAGMAAVCSHFNPGVFPEKDERRHYALRGKSLGGFGLFWDIWIKNINLYGEVSLSIPGSAAGVAGLTTSAYRTKISVTAYWFSPQHYTIHSSFMGVSPAANRAGMYWGLQNRIVKRIAFSMYYDMRKTLWRTYTLPMPHTDTDLLMHWKIRISKKIRLIARAKQKHGYCTVRPPGMEGTGPCMARTSTSKIRAEIQYKCSDATSVRVRAEGACCRVEGHNQPGKGFLGFAGIVIKRRKKNVLGMRIIMFNTPSYSSRIYEFERDLPGVMTNTMLYGTGFRFYVFASYSISEHLIFSAKWAYTNYPGRASLFSGYSEIDGTDYSKVGVQAEVLF